MKQITRGTPELLQRLRCYATGDFEGASAISAGWLEQEGAIPWLASGGRGDLAEYALQASLRSLAHAESATENLQGKATSLIGIALASSAAGLAATNASLHVVHNPGWITWVSFALWCVVDLALLVAALYAFLATATRYGHGVNVARLRGHDGTADGIKPHEALEWHRATLSAMETAKRLGTDVFTSRRWLLAALIVAMLATVATVTLAA